MSDSPHFRQQTGEEHKATWLELFLDLVFVFAVTQLSHLLLSHLTPHGAAQTLFLLLVVWWAWIYTAWMTNWFDPDAVPVRLILLAVMAASLLMAVAIPQAFGDHAMLFAAAYVFLQVSRNVFNVWATDAGTAFRRLFLLILVWSLASSVFWIAGGFASDTLRVALWVAALAIDYVAPSVSYRVPGLGRSGSAEWDIEGAHFAERFQLFIIIALGESIVVTGGTASSHELTATAMAALAYAFVVTAALWWLYFDEVGWRGQRRLRHSQESAALARDAYTYLHIPIVAGIIVAAVGNELVIAHPTRAAGWAGTIVIVGGPVLYLLGHLSFRLRMIHNVTRKRVAATAALIAVAPLGAISGLVLGAAVAGILVVLAVAETKGRLLAEATA
jgi:low temperature requirement protein LtrA